jgi:lactoylglutathione lyase
MYINHIAIWVNDLEMMRNFYQKYFNAASNQLYKNEVTGFTSYFLSFDNGCRLELMHNASIANSSNHTEQIHIGIAHLAISLGNKDAVNALTEKLRYDGYHIKGEPRMTGDGYYESVVLDPEGNVLELTV